MENRFFRISYAFIVLVVWAVLHTSQLFSPGECWTVVNVVHGLVCLYFFGNFIGDGCQIGSASTE